MAKIYSHPTEPVHKSSSTPNFRNSSQYKHGTHSQGDGFETILQNARKKLDNPEVLSRMKHIYGRNIKK